MEHSLHSSDDQLELYALDRLPEVEVAALEDHLIICGSCRERLEQVGNFAFAMRDALHQFPAHAEPETFRFQWFASLFQPRFAVAMACALMLVAVAGVYKFGNAGLPPVATLQLVPNRGAMMETPRAKELDLTLTQIPAEGGPFAVELVDASGKQVYKGALSTAPIAVKSLAEGDYFLRLNNASGALVHEYGFKVHP